MVLPIQSFQIPPIVTCNYSNQDPDVILEHKNVLSVIDFGNQNPSAPTERSRYFHTGLPVLGKPLCEVWHSHSAVVHGLNEGCYWSANDELMFIGLWIDESRYRDFNTAIFESYTTLLQTLQQQNYPHLLRIWNYLARINDGDNDHERYKQFCIGRHQAFSHNQQYQYPAATAVGHKGSGSLIYLIASRRSIPQFFENPGQLSAFHYPREYGPKSPSFARASLLQGTDGKQLYISGTASIYGHQSQHLGNFDGQMALTCENIATLLQHIADQLQLATTPNLEQIKVYLRYPQDLDKATAAIAHYFGSSVAVLFVQGDICRQELLVEIEGMCQIAH